jgi:hypothetical protein
MPTAPADLAELPSPPTKRSDFDAWAAWAKATLAAGRAPFLRDPAIHDDDEKGERTAVACRALLAAGTGTKLAPEYAPDATLALFGRAHTVGPLVLRAGEILARRAMESGATSADVLYLVAAFAWSLRDVSPDIGDRAWAYLVHAPWQTDAAVLLEMCQAADRSGAMGDDRRLIDLADARLEAGVRDGARELLEAMALVQADVSRLEDLTSGAAFGTKARLADADAALLRLGRIYLEEGETQVYARAVFERAARLESEPDAFIEALSERTWDRPFEELYEWSKQLTRPEALDDEVRRVLGAEQPHHARRLVEAVLVRHFDDPLFRPSDRTIVRTIGRFRKTEASELLQRTLARRAAEHLAILYPRTNYFTSHAREFVEKVVQITGFVGAGGPLNEVRDELELFVNRGDPYLLLREQEALLDAARAKMTDDERRARDAVGEWFTERYGSGTSGTLERAIVAVTAPIGDAARMFGNLPGIEEACEAAFRTLLQARGSIAGDLDPWFAEGARIREDHGVGIQLLVAAREAGRYERISAAAVSGASAFLPPGLSVAAGAADLGATLLVTYRAIARVGALFGRDVRTEDGFRFTTDSFALGCSTTDGEGLLAYLSRGKRQVLRPLSIGSVVYGAKTLAEYLWTTPGRSSRIIAEQSIRHLARLCGIGLSERAVARVVPVGGAILSGIAAYAFIGQVVEAAIHVAARDALLRRVGAGDGPGEGPEDAEISDAVG